MIRIKECPNCGEIWEEEAEEEEINDLLENELFYEGQHEMLICKKCLKNERGLMFSKINERLKGLGGD